MFWRTRLWAGRGPGFLRPFRERCYNALLAARGSFIPLSVEFHGQPLFPHGTVGVFFAPNAVVGSGCVFYQHAVVGRSNLADGRRNGDPVLGDNVFLGAGAMVIGAVKIGDNVRIGANCVVVEDVAANSVVVAAPVRVIQKDSPPDNRPTQWRAGELGFQTADGWQPGSKTEL